MLNKPVKKTHVLKVALVATVIAVVATGSFVLSKRVSAQGAVPLHIPGSLTAKGGVNQLPPISPASSPLLSSPASSSSSTSPSTGCASGTTTASASSGALHGWLWSDMPDQSDEMKVPNDQEAGRGFGWISLNSTDAGSSYSYGVTLNSNGTLSGDAWTSNGGWLDFAPSGPYPTYGNPINVLPAMPARIDPACLASGGSSCAVTGWARFVAGEDTNTQDTGGWDGWVNMSGHSYSAASSNPVITSSFGVTYDADPSSPGFGTFSGYAWGGTDAGWIGFSKASITPSTTTTCGSSTTPGTATTPGTSTTPGTGGQNSAVCGTAAGTVATSIPSGTAALCTTGTPSAVTGPANGPWSWTCIGANKTVIPCTTIAQAVSLAGACDTTTIYGCLIGSVTQKGGTGAPGDPITWYCTGLNGGSLSQQCTLAPGGPTGPIQPIYKEN